MKTIAAANNNNSINISNNKAPTTVGSTLIGAGITIIPKSELLATSTDVTLTTAASFQAPNSTNAPMKRPASLDLHKVTQAKKQRLVTPTPLHFDTPDLQNNKPLNTPDLEKIILSTNLLQTPQPGLVLPSNVVQQITSEQEAFGKGFEEALSSLHNSKSLQAQFNNNNNNNNTNNNNTNTTTIPAMATLLPAASTTTTTAAVTGMSGGSFTYTNLETYPSVTIKDEPLNAPASPPVSPIDMETQEKIKLERKRQRNRVAASKCRKRKLERISKLEDKVKILKGENSDLAQSVKALKDHIAQLKQEVIEHIETGCSIPTIYNSAGLLQGK